MTTPREQQAEEIAARMEAEAAGQLGPAIAETGGLVQRIQDALDSLDEILEKPSAIHVRSGQSFHDAVRAEIGWSGSMPPQEYVRVGGERHVATMHGIPVYESVSVPENELWIRGRDGLVRRRVTWEPPPKHIGQRDVIEGEIVQESLGPYTVLENGNALIPGAQTTIELTIRACREVEVGEAITATLNGRAMAIRVTHVEHPIASDTTRLRGIVEP